MVSLISDTVYFLFVDFYVLSWSPFKGNIDSASAIIFFSSLKYKTFLPYYSIISLHINTLMIKNSYM